jgi:hypothetical protein
MDEYIKREAALAICEEEYREQLRILNYAGDSVAWNIGHAIKELPAADVAPVVHGRWEYIPQTLNTLSQFRCPFCRWWSLDPSIDGAYNYCPNCGAKMDEKEATYD